MKIATEHIGIPATDPVALKNWYERVLDAKTIWDSGENPPAYLVAFPGGGWLEIYAAQSSQAEPGNNQITGFRHLALRVDSLEAAKAEAARRGVVFTKEPGPAAGGGRVQYFADLEGNLLHFVERAKDAKLS
jgi:catechol 2,3-dioxygenase-like lactoylglutathione lyase family enzyme